MNKFMVPLLALSMSGCFGPWGGDCKDGGCGEDTSRPDGPRPQKEPEWDESYMESVELRCQDAGKMSYIVVFYGRGDGLIRVDAMDTQSPTPWNDSHELALRTSLSSGKKRFEVGLAHGVPQADWQSGVSTHFGCTDHVDAGVMTFVYRAYDDTGALVDCRYQGHDGAGVIAGAYDAPNPITNATELAGCTAL